MNTFYIILIGISLSADACATLFSYSLGKNNLKLNEALLLCLSFGLFQGVMPYLGYKLFNEVSKYFILYSKYISFAVLFIIGLMMIFEKDNEKIIKLSIREVLLLSIATSIDAFIVGTTFNFYNYNIAITCFSISIITLILTVFTFLVSKKIEFFNKFATKKVGGVILILLGLKELFI